MRYDYQEEFWCLTAEDPFSGIHLFDGTKEEGQEHLKRIKDYDRSNFIDSDYSLLNLKTVFSIDLWLPDLFKHDSYTLEANTTGGKVTIFKGTREECRDKLKDLKAIVKLEDLEHEQKSEMGDFRFELDRDTVNYKIFREFAMRYDHEKSVRDKEDEKLKKHALSSTLSWKRFIATVVRLYN